MVPGPYPVGLILNTKTDTFLLQSPCHTQKGCTYIYKHAESRIAAPQLHPASSFFTSLFICPPNTMVYIAAHTPPYTPPHSPLPQCHRSTYYHLRSPEDSGESEPEDGKDTDFCNFTERMEIDEDAYVHPQAQSPFLSLCPEVRF